MPFSPFIFGTTRLGHSDVSKSQAIAVAEAAMDSGIWFHTSRQYDHALEILGAAYESNPSKLPPTIYKIGGRDMIEVRNVIDQNLAPLGRKSMEVGQISPTQGIGDGLINGSVVSEFDALRQEGLVDRFVMEVFPWTSDTVLAAIRNGHLEGLVDAFILYLNPLQRFANNQLWDELLGRNLPIISLRTVAGGNVHRLAEVPGAAWKPYLQERATQIAPIFDESGIVDWSEFCIRFAHSIPGVLATVGSTSRLEGLAELLKHSKDITPLPAEIMEEIFSYQRTWSETVDALAEPWTM